MKKFFLKYMGIILIISSISLAGIFNLMKIASGNIYQGTYSSNQINGIVNKDLIQAMAGNDIISSGKGIDILLWQRI
jgi:hypothetical protein